MFGRFLPEFGKYALILVALNEIRGVFVIYAMLGRWIGHH